MFQKIYFLALLLIIVFSADKEAWKKRSIYQLLTDRFARNDGQQTSCSNLGTIHNMKVIIVEVDTEE